MKYWPLSLSLSTMPLITYSAQSLAIKESNYYNNKMRNKDIKCQQQKGGTSYSNVKHYHRL